MTTYSEIANSLPPVYPGKLLGEVKNLLSGKNLSIIVLDDDPTGTQTVYDVPVLTVWDSKQIEFELVNKTELFFILTNSRGLNAEDANALSFEIGQNIRVASQKIGRKTLVISRGDSTLRGHYPNEVNALGRGLGIDNPIHLLIPAFFQGGRFTVNDIHWVRDGNTLLPVAETPYARDNTFGYRSSDLKDYVEEKSNGQVKSKDVFSISIDDIRIGGTARVTAKLDSLKTGTVCIVNAFEQSDLDVFASGFYASSLLQKEVLLRTAASVIPSLAGLEQKAPLESKDLTLRGKGGIIAVGSYVPRTTEQFEYLKKLLPLDFVEIDVRKILNRDLCDAEIMRVGNEINHVLKNDKLVVVYTSREIIKGVTGEESLSIVNRISQGMVSCITQTEIRPRFFIAKGGITSSDIATKALKVNRPMVLGQILPGVPLWNLNDCEKFPGLAYVPFPGNIGDETYLYQAVAKFMNAN